MNYEQLEQNLVDRITGMLPTNSGITVVVLPEKQSEFDRPAPGKEARISVCYGGSKFEDSPTTWEIAQPETMRIELQLQSTTLRKGLGIYALAKLAWSCLLGYKPTWTVTNPDQTTRSEGSDKLTLSDFKFTDFESGVWTYTMTLESRAFLVQSSDEETEILISMITSIGLGETTIIPEPETDSNQILTDTQYVTTDNAQ